MKNWKINTALFLCAAFMFRILFFNAFTSTPFRPQNSHFAVKTNFSAVTKRKTELTVTGNPASIESALAEFREEENNHQRTGLESSPSAVIQVMHFPLAGQMSSKLTRILPSHHYFSQFGSDRYLTLQVLRT